MLRTVRRVSGTLCFIVGLVAVLILAGALFLSSWGVPERVLERVRSAAAGDGLSLALRSAVWRPWFTLRVDSPSVSPSAAPDIQISARSVDLAFAVDLGVAPTAPLRHIAFQSAHLVCPAPAGVTNRPMLDLRDASGSVAIEPGHVALSTAGRLADVADLRVSGRIRRSDLAPPVAAPTEGTLLGDRLAEALRRAAEIQGRVRDVLRDLQFDQMPAVRVELLPGDAAGGVSGVRVLAEGGEGHWRSIPFERWSADVAWTAPGSLVVRRLQVRSESGRVDAEGDVDLTSGRFTARAEGTLLPSLVATLLPANSNAAPWVALVKDHPRGLAEVVVSGVTTNLRAAAWSLAWRSDAETRAAPLVVHRAAVSGSNGVVRVLSADVSCRDVVAVLPDAWRSRLGGLDLSNEGPVRARADVAWSAPGSLVVRRLQVSSESGRVDAEGDVDIASGRFTARGTGTLLPSLVAPLLPANSNAAPWVALVENHPKGRAEAAVSGVATNLRAAVWSLAWRSDAGPRAAPLVVHRAALDGSNGVVRVLSADVSCRDVADVLPDVLRCRLGALDLSSEGSVRARLVSPVDVLPADANRTLRASVEADCVRWRGVTMRSGRATLDVADRHVRVHLLDAEVDAPWRNGRLEGEVEYSAANHETRIRAHFRGDPGSLFPALPEGPREGLRVLRFEDPATVDAACRVEVSTSTVWRVDVQVAASRMKVREEPVEALTLSLAIEPGHVRSPQMNMVIGGGLVRGTWDYDWNAKVLQFDASSSAEPHTVIRAADPDLDVRLADLKAGGPVWVTLAGTIPFGTSPGAGLNLRGHVVGESVGWERFIAQRARAVLEIDSTNVAVTVSDAQWCSGVLSGQVKVPMQRGATCSMSWQVTDAAYPQVSRLLGRDLNEKRDAGLLSGDFRLAGPLGTNFLATASGSGSAHLRNGYLMSMPLFGGLSAYLSVLIPGFGYAEQREARADFVIGDNAVKTDNARLLGRLVSVGLNGSYRFDGVLDFRVEVLFLKEGLTAAVTRLLTSPLTKALQFQLTGTLEKPEWWPVNTPTRLLNFFKRQLSWIPGVSDGAPAEAAAASAP